MAIDPKGNIWLASQTDNAQFPLTAPLQSIVSVGSLEPVSVLSEFDPAAHHGMDP
jgi:hypothetical protein